MKFSIRDLLLVTVIVALAVGWLLERSQLRARVEELEIVVLNEGLKRYKHGGNYVPNFSTRPKFAYELGLPHESPN
jgi:hypothetical protein